MFRKASMSAEVITGPMVNCNPMACRGGPERIFSAALPSPPEKQSLGLSALHKLFLALMIGTAPTSDHLDVENQSEILKTPKQDTLAHASVEDEGEEISFVESEVPAATVQANLLADSSEPTTALINIEASGRKPKGRTAACSKVMTSLKKILVSCVKPKVEAKDMEASRDPSPAIQVDAEEDLAQAELEAAVGIAQISLVEEDEADFDDPPGLIQLSTAAASSPITAVSKDFPTMSPLEFYRQRISRFVLTYKYTGPLLPDVSIHDLGKKCLVLDLDETLIHSQFNQTTAPDLSVPVQFEDMVKPIFVYKRPGVDEFLEYVGKHFEVVIFTASLASYADPVIDFLDRTKTIKYRLYRESCVFAEGLYLKDLRRLGRSLDQTILIDNAATSYLLQPDNGVAILSWFSDMEDKELLGRLMPALADLPRSTDVFEWKRKWATCISH